MNKLVLLLLLVCLPCGDLLAKDQSITIDEAIQQAGDYITNNDFLLSGTTVAIINIESSANKISEHIIEKLTTLLVNDGSLVVVSRDSRDRDLIRKELNYQMSGEVSDETFVGIGKQLGAQTIIIGSFDPIGSRYKLVIRVLDVKSGKLQGQPPAFHVRSDMVLQDLERRRLYLGARAGLSPGFYGNGGELLNRTEFSSQTLKDNSPFKRPPDVAVYTSVSIWSLLALQAEALYTRDSFSLNYDSNTMTVSYNSLIIPLLAKAVYRPSFLTVQGFAGPYLSLPLGQMEIKHSNGSYNADFPLMFGIMAGGGLGVKLGPGSVMADIRYAMDFGNVTANYNGTRDVSHRNKLCFALGYEMGLPLQ